MWIKFNQDFPWKPTPQSLIAYKAGMTKNVTKACGDAAIAAGKGEEVNRPNRGKKTSEGEGKN